MIRFSRAGIKINARERAKVTELLRKHSIKLKNKCPTPASDAAPPSATSPTGGAQASVIVESDTRPSGTDNGGGRLSGLEALQRRLAAMQRSGKLLSEEESQALEDCVGELCVSGSSPSSSSNGSSKGGGGGQVEWELLQLSNGLSDDDEAFVRQLRRREVLEKALAAARAQSSTPVL